MLLLQLQIQIYYATLHYATQITLRYTNYTTHITLHKLQYYYYYYDDDDDDDDYYYYYY